MKFLRALSFLLVFSFLVFVVFIPLAHIFKLGLSREIFEPQILSVVRFTVFQAALSTLFSAIAGVVLGLWISRSKRLSYITEFLLAAPFTVPTVVAAAAWLYWLSPKLLNLSYSLEAIVLAHFFFNAPWIALQTAQACSQIPEEELESARTLGASHFALTTSLLLPRLRWSILSVCSQVFSFCLMSFALVLLLGGGPPMESLETSIYSSLRMGYFDFHSASTFAFWQILLNILPWILILIAQAKAKRLILPVTSTPSHYRVRWPALGILVCGFFLLPYLLPLVTLKAAAFSSVFEETEFWSSLRVSATLALFAAFGSILIALSFILALRSVRHKMIQRSLETLATLSGSLSILALGLGFFAAYLNWLNPFEGSWTAMILLQIAVFSPVAFRGLWPVSLGEQTKLLEAAASLGAKPFRAFFTVEWPRWRRPLFSLGAMIAGASIGEVAAVSLFASENLTPLSFWISRLMQRYRFEEARALSALLLLASLSTLGVLLVASQKKSRVS